MVALNLHSALGFITSCQSTPISEIVKCFWSCVWFV